MTIYLLESAICMACFYGFYHLVLRRETFFQWSRAYLLLTPLLALLLPALHIRLERSAVPPQPVAVQVTPPAAGSALSPWVEQAQATPLALRRYDWSRPIAEGWSLSVSDVLWGLYGVGAVVLAVLLSLRFGRLYQLLRRCRRERHGDVTFATSEQEEVPLASFFGFVFWNQDAQLSESQRFLLEHELVHVRQRHSLDVLLMEVMVVVQWFNPLMHAFRHSLCAVHEYIADDYVVRHTRQRRAYATLLVQQAAAGTRAPSGAGLVNTFHSLIKQRLIMLAKRPSRPLARAKFALALPLAAGLMLLFSFRLVDTLPAAAPLRQALTAAARYAATLSEVTIAAEKPAPLPPAEPEPTPYIFYWGQFQCNILHNPTDDTYIGSVSVTPAVFRSSIQREPRLWDGNQRTMMADCQLQITHLRLRSDYDSPNAYAATLKGLNEYAYTLVPGETVWIKDLTLPNGKTATLDIQLAGSPSGRNGPNPGLIFNNSTGGMKINSSHSAHKHWGAALWDYASTHDFITEQQFWAMVKQSPLFFSSEEQIEEGSKRSLLILPAPALALSMQQSDGSTMQRVKSEAPLTLGMRDPVELNIRYGSLTRESDIKDNLSTLFGYSDLIQPGTKVYFRSGTKVTDTTEEPAKEIDTMMDIAVLEIVDENDSRLTLGRPSQKTFSFEWGKLSRTVGGFYGVSQHTKENTWLPTDSPMGLFHYEIGLPDVFQMFGQTPHLWRLDEQLPAPSFSLLYHDHKATYDPQNGLQPTDFVSMLKREMKPGEQLVLTDFLTSTADLRTLKIILVPHDGLGKATLPRAASDVEKQRFVAEHFSVSPNPATDRALLRFSLPEAAAGTLRITNTLGQEVYSFATDFAEGESTYPLDTRDLKVKGQFFATLDFAFGKCTVAFVVQ